MIPVVTSDKKIWNEIEVYTNIVEHMILSKKIDLHFCNEGPDIECLGLYDFLYENSKKFNYATDQITIHCCNMIENHPVFMVKKSAPMHLLNNAREYTRTINKKITKHFGLFVGRSNSQRLRLAVYLDSHYPEKTLISYHFNRFDEFHQSNVGLEELITNVDYKDFDLASSFLKKCPMFAANRTSTVIDKTLPINPAQQLFQQDHDTFPQLYENFFVEIVCESYFTGKTFFPTEKTFRPMLLKTPFIIQGPKNFLTNLKTLGFKTFDQWWDEGYSQDPGNHQSVEIFKVLDYLAAKPLAELDQIYQEMQDVIDHNYNLALTLTLNDFNKIK